MVVVLRMVYNNSSRDAGSNVCIILEVLSYDKIYVPVLS